MQMENIKLTCSKLIAILGSNGIKIDHSPNIDMILDNYDIIDVKITKTTQIVKVPSARPGAVMYGGENPTADISDNEYRVKFIEIVNGKTNWSGQISFSSSNDDSEKEAKVPAMLWV